jgi:biotin synthase-like enzyme
VRQAGITACSGGIIGLGENRGVRHSHAAPTASSTRIRKRAINLGPGEGTLLGDARPKIRSNWWTIATARILMLRSFVRSAPDGCRHRQAQAPAFSPAPFLSPAIAC